MRGQRENRIAGSPAGFPRTLRAKTHHAVTAIAACAVLAALAGCGPDDGVESMAFALLPASDMTVPSAAEVGMEMTPFYFERSTGTVVGNVEGRALRVVIDGLPPIATSLTSPFYNFTLLVGDEPILPQGSGKIGHIFARACELVGGGPAFAHGEPTRVNIGRITPDPLGHTELTLTDTDIRLDFLVGGVIEIIVPQVGDDPKLYKVLEGEVGNIADAGGVELPDDGGGHHH